VNFFFFLFFFLFTAMHVKSLAFCMWEWRRYTQYNTKKWSRLVLTKTEHMALQQLKKDPSIQSSPWLTRVASPQI